MNDPVKIVVLDGWNMNPGDLQWTELEVLGSLTVYDRTPEDMVVARSIGADVLVVNKIKLNAEVLRELPDLKMIAVTATGYDNVDLGITREKGIVVSNAVNYSTNSVIQYVIACVFYELQGIADHDKAVEGGEWSRMDTFSFTLFPIREWHNVTLGVIGLGNIGSGVAKMAAAMGMPVKAWNRSPRDPIAGVTYCSLEEVLSTSDIITLHLPLAAGTHHLINREKLQFLKKGAVLINAGRGGLVDGSALIEALDSGHVKKAYLDVLEKEPPLADDPVIGHPGTVVTPHLAWCSVQARTELLRQTIENISGYLKAQPIRQL